jgi:AraC family transcriptional regulator
MSIHGESAGHEPRFHLAKEESSMKIEIDSKPAQRVAALTHIGPYNMIGQTFGRLNAIAEAAGLLAQPGAQMVAIYHDDPDTKPATELHSDPSVALA